MNDCSDFVFSGNLKDFVQIGITRKMNLALFIYQFSGLQFLLEFGKASFPIFRKLHHYRYVYLNHN